MERVVRMSVSGSIVVVVVVVVAAAVVAAVVVLQIHVEGQMQNKILRYHRTIRGILLFENLAASRHL